VCLCVLFVDSHVTFVVFHHHRITVQLYERSLTISSFKTLDSVVEIDFEAPVGTAYALTPSSTVTIIDQFEEYVDVLKTCFDFDALRDFSKRPGFSLLFDGMHGAGGPFARRVLVEELGMPEVGLTSASMVTCNAGGTVD
jgi:phosphoglucomutase